MTEPRAVHLRPAGPADASTLSELALRSKGYWGYDNELLEACRAELTVDAAEVEARHATVAVDASGRTIGFYTLDGEPPHGELGMLFVEPDRIGSGVGRLLWSDMTGRAASLGFRELRIEADPGAASFYLAMGATVVGTAPSGSIDGRQLPLLVFDVAPRPGA